MTDGAGDQPPIWANWSGRHVARAGRVHLIRSEEDAAALAASATAEGSTIRAAGAGHSHQPLIPAGTGDESRHIIADLSGLSGVISADRATERAWVWAGTPIHALGRPLHDAGLALHNQGDIDRQFIGGAVSTGTHGTGHRLTNLSAAVTAARVVLASGEMVTVSRANAPEQWEVARLSLGGLGLITAIELQLREAFKLAEEASYLPWDAVAPDLATLQTATRHYEFFWMPERDLVVAKAIDETDADPVYPIASEGKRVGWNYEVLPNRRIWPHTEMEYSIDAADGPEVMAAIRAMIRRDFPDMPWPVEYRTLAADDVWISTASGRDTVTISLHMDVNEDDRPLFDAAETIFRAAGGRPHWGKVHNQRGEELARHYPRWSDWWRVRDGADPAGTFLNQHLRDLRT